MKTIILLLIVTLISSQLTLGQGIVGEQHPDTGEPSYTYSYDSEFLLLAPNWLLTNGTILSSGNTGTHYWATVKFTTAGSGSITIRRGTMVTSTLALTIVSPPSAPTAPVFETYNCGSTSVKRPVPPSGVTYYWQTSSNGKSTANSDLIYSSSILGPVYLRSKLNGFDNWSTTSSSYNVGTIYTAPVPGIVSGSASHYYNSASGQLSLTGNQGTIDKWQRRLEGGVWQDVAASASQSSINFTGLDENWEYRVMVSNAGCPAVASPAFLIKVIHRNFEGLISGSQFITGTSNNNTLQLQNCTGTVAEWQFSNNGLDWVAIPSSASTSLVITDLTNERYFRVKVQKKGTISYTNSHFVRYEDAITTNLAAQNYVRTEAVRIAEANILNVPGLTSTQKHTQDDFKDGLGRVVESVSRSASPGQNDIVSFQEYDQNGGAEKHFLPYTSSGSLFYEHYIQQQLAFYNGTAKVAVDASPFSETITEPSPLGRVIETGGIGDNFQPGSGHTTRIIRRSNNANEIKIWKPNATSSAYYPAGTLQVAEITDPNGDKLLTFTDKNGNLIEKHQQSTSTYFLKTRYIYDASGRLKYILQPQGVKMVGTSNTISSTNLSRFAFQYTYDNKGRLVQEKAPGKEPSYVVFDPINRPVLVQDGLLRSGNKWMFIKYDVKSRPVISGIYIHNSSLTQSGMQTLLDGLYLSSNTNYPPSSWFETRGTVLHGYTNSSFPKANANGSALQILSVSYYDTYDFDDVDTNPDFSYINQLMPGESAQAQGDSYGLPTGSKQVVLGTTNWLYSYIFYDKRGRVIQTRSNNHLNLSAVDNLITSVYDFEGKVLSMKTYHNAGPGKTLTTIEKFEYDSKGRVLKTYQNNNSAPADQLLTQIEYNEVGQVVDRKIHKKPDGTFLQSVDYRYNAFGHLESINNAQLLANSPNNDDSDSAPDHFGMEFLYEKTEAGLSNTPFFNGALSAIKWKGPYAFAGLAGVRSVKYQYDKAGRLQQSSSAQNNGTGWTQQVGVYNEVVTYDDNGNVLTLKRNDRKYQAGTVPVYVQQMVDDLTFTYSSDNKLLKVEDAVALVSGTVGFKNGTNESIEYTYDIDGHATSDKNKGINNISYNDFGKPVLITFSDTRKIEYVYDAAGQKLSTRHFDVGSSSANKVLDYVNRFVYENNTLSFFGSSAGRVVKNGSSFEYEYGIADQQGNTRVLFTSATPNVDNTTVSFETLDNPGVHNYPTGGNRNSQANFNHTVGATSTYSHLLNGGNGSQVGVGKSFKIYPGDKVRIEAYGKYFNPSSNSVNLAGFGSALASAFGLSSSSTGESLLAYQELSGYAGIVGSGGGPTSSTFPKLFVTILVFDKHYNFLDIAYEQIDGGEQIGISPKTPHDQMVAEYVAREEGFAYLFISNESPTYVEGYFDDVSFTYTPTNVVQYNEYYSFGLLTSASWTRHTAKDNRHLYNEGTELNAESGYYETPFRLYDPVLARFMQVDPLAAATHAQSPYVYANNNPSNQNDPTGLYSDNDWSLDYNGVVPWVLHADGSIGPVGTGAGERRMAKLHALGYAIGFGNADRSRALSRGAAMLGLEAWWNQLKAAALRGDAGAIQQMQRAYETHGFGVSGGDENFSVHVEIIFPEYNSRGIVVKYESIIIPFEDALMMGLFYSPTQQGLQDVTEKFYAQLKTTELFYRRAREMFDAASVLSLADRYVLKLHFFANTIGHNRQFDIKQFGRGFNWREIGELSWFEDLLFQWDDYGNINYGFAARAFGLTLEEALFGAGFQQVFGDGNGPADFSNLRGYFDEARDTEMIIFGYNMRMPWE